MCLRKGNVGMALPVPEHPSVTHLPSCHMPTMGLQLAQVMFLLLGPLRTRWASQAVLVPVRRGNTSSSRGAPSHCPSCPAGQGSQQEGRAGFLPSVSSCDLQGEIRQMIEHSGFPCPSRERRGLQSVSALQTEIQYKGSAFDSLQRDMLQTQGSD